MATTNGSTAIRDKILASLARYRALRIGKFPCAFWRLSARPGLTANDEAAFVRSRCGRRAFRASPIRCVGERIMATGVPEFREVAWRACELEGGSFQYRESLAYEIKPKSLRLLKEAGLPQEFLAILKSLKNEKYPTQKLFMEAIYSIADNVR
ncbi:hypothetical protein [Bathymodiolus japonicus methanotrophic gill symbiont]|uniref:hypothetical protein n=1 Tax=Bathymodiolus japonicus methanotrophic gill symbiont TaxID=113269 RepID=UPI001C8D0C2E|nr:hypothetical protein [Bathymodiolus japonicus methanotrophic gill symbiont]